MLTLLAKSQAERREEARPYYMSGLEKSAVHSSGVRRFFCPASNFSFSLAQFNTIPKCHGITGK